MFTPMGEFIIQSVVQCPPVNCLMFGLISLFLFLAFGVFLFAFDCQASLQKHWEKGRSERNE